jgi:RNA polymerase sigma-70 factor, ECF subfamily
VPALEEVAAGTVADIAREPAHPVSQREPVDDTLLIARAQSGSKEALDALLRCHFDRVYAVCRRITGNDADAADASQETLVRVVRGLGRFDARARFSTWVYRIAVNASLDEIRRRSRRPAAIGIDADAVETGGGPASVIDRLDIDSALQKVAPEFRAAVVLRDLCGMDYAEIARTLAIPVGTAKSRVARGRAVLARLLGDPGGEP